MVKRDVSKMLQSFLHFHRGTKKTRILHFTEMVKKFIVTNVKIFFGSVTLIFFMVTIFEKNKKIFGKSKNGHL